MAAWMRLGATSVAIIDSDTSTATMMMPSSFGTRCGRVGCAMATTTVARPAMASAVDACRRHPSDGGAMLPSNAGLV